MYKNQQFAIVVGIQLTKQVVVAMHTHASNRNRTEDFSTNNTELLDMRVTLNFRSAIGTVRFISIIIEEVTKCHTNMTSI
jgi:hypothetical protein